MGLARSSKDVLDQASDLTGWFAPSLALACAAPLRFSLRRVLGEVSSFPERSSPDLSLPSRELLRKPSSRGLVCPAASRAVSSPSAFSRKVSSHIPPRFPSLG
jgi:hypothetical protein